MWAQQSAVALLTTEIILSLLIGLVDAIYVNFYSPARNVAIDATASCPQIRSATKDAGWAFGTPVGIYGGIFTPPFGLNLFASQAIFKQPLATIYRGAVPFAVINFLALILISNVPVI